MTKISKCCNAKLYKFYRWQGYSCTKCGKTPCDTIEDQPVAGWILMIFALLQAIIYFLRED